MRTLAVMLILLSLTLPAMSEEWKPIVLKAKSYRDTGSSLVIVLSSGKTIEVAKDDWSVNWSEAIVGAQEKQEKEKTARSSAEPPDDSTATALIESKCATEWPDDFKMRKYCQDQQQEALEALRAREMSGPLEKIRTKCAREWSEDFRMRDYCEKEQLQALRELSRP